MFDASDLAALSRSPAARAVLLAELNQIRASAEERLRRPGSDGAEHLAWGALLDAARAGIHDVERIASLLQPGEALLSLARHPDGRRTVLIVGPDDWPLDGARTRQIEAEALRAMRAGRLDGALLSAQPLREDGAEVGFFFEGADLRARWAAPAADE